VGVASTKATVTVGVNVPLTSGKETRTTKTFTGMLVIWKTLKD
jgi:hypothetical protein